MTQIEVKTFFYDLIHCKDKILSNFDQWDEKYPDDERGALVAGIQESPNDQLINFLMNVQKLASGFQQIQDMITAAEQAEVEEAMRDDDDDDDDDDD